LLRSRKLNDWKMQFIHVDISPNYGRAAPAPRRAELGDGCLGGGRSSLSSSKHVIMGILQLKK
jgi:hypothetical protein